MVSLSGNLCCPTKSWAAFRKAVCRALAAKVCAEQSAAEMQANSTVENNSLTLFTQIFCTAFSLIRQLWLLILLSRVDMAQLRLPADMIFPVYGF